MSTYPALLEPVCRRRQLPPTPVTSLRRSSSPRILPTPPPISPIDVSRCPSAALLERRASGRILPRPPMVDIQPSQQSPVQTSPSPIVTPEPIPELPIEADAPDSPLIQRFGDFASLDHDTPDGTRSQSSSLSPSIEQIASKSSSDGEDPLAHGLDPALYGPNAPVTCASPCTSDPGAVPSSSSFSGSEPRPTGLGLLHCLLQHFPVRKRLRVSILKIEGLAGPLKPDLEMMAICKVSIPGLKSGKEQISEIKRGRDPIFNQEFFFDHVTIEDLDTKNISITAFHHGGAKLGKDLMIGEATVPLREIRELNTKKEVKVIEEIKQAIPKKLGKLYISSCIEKDARRLTINLKKADDLPRWSFLGAPGAHIKTLTAWALDMVIEGIQVDEALNDVDSKMA
nr:C2 calcium-dependent membrane targeting domain containing protein [Haemonchus contortus]